MGSDIGSWSRVLFHILCHPIGKLFFAAESKPSTLATVRLEAGLNIVAGLATVFGARCEPVSLGHTVNMNGLLESGDALLVKNFYIR